MYLGTHSLHGVPLCDCFFLLSSFCPRVSSSGSRQHSGLDLLYGLLLGRRIRSGIGEKGRLGVGSEFKLWNLENPGPSDYRHLCDRVSRPTLRFSSRPMIPVGIKLRLRQWANGNQYQN